MDHPLHVNRTTDDLADATLVAMEATGTWARTVMMMRVAVVGMGLLLGVMALSLGLSFWLLGQDTGFTVVMLVAIALGIGYYVWRAPVLSRRSVKQRLAKQWGEQVRDCTGPRALWITDAGLSDSGSGISTTIAWDRITHHVVTPERHVFCAGLAAIIDIPRRGDVGAVDHFAAHAASRMHAAPRSALS